MIKKNIPINGSNALILGITFKENCPDVRNTKVVDLIKSLKDYGINITVYDPIADEQEVLREYNLKSTSVIPKEKFDSIILAVAHNNFLKIDLDELSKSNSVIYDIKNFFDPEIIDKSL
tara:strand:- start:202 stop:558 length:357 start_codon:yes stop_codon:yes gene_type:complete